VSTSAQLTIVVANGEWGTVEFAVRLSGRCLGRDFLNSLSKTGRARCYQLFQQFADAGMVQLKRFEHIDGQLCSLRHEIEKSQLRFPCFQDGSKWIVTHGFKKPGAKKKLGRWPQTEIDRGFEIMGEYVQRKKQLERKAGN
jgi:hypothetical protein